MNLIIGHRKWLPLLLFILIGWLLYGNSLDAPFYFDDAPNISESLSTRLTDLSPRSLWRTWSEGLLGSRPLANLSFGMNYYLHQFRVPGYHTVNISIHILSGIFLYLLFAAILRSPALAGRYRDSSGIIALAAALLWFVNPVHVQSVTYIVQRMNSMAAMFYVLSLWLYMRGRLTPSARAGRVWLAGAAGAGLCALGSKEIAATLPVMVFLCEWYFIQDLSRAWLKRALPFILALAGLFLFIVFLHLGADPLAAIQDTYRHRDFTLGERMLTELRVVVFYLSLFFYPAPQRLNLDHHFALSGSPLEPVATLLAGFLIVFLAGAAILGARRGSTASTTDGVGQPGSAWLSLLFSFALAWFLLNLLIESTVIGLEIIFEHRLYLPSMFLTLPLVAAAHRLIEPAWLKTGALALLLLTCAAWTVERNELWRDPVALWADSSAKSPGKARTRNNLAVVLWEDGQLVRAEFEAGEAIRLDPNDVDAFNSLGNIYKDQGRPAQAVQAYRNALRLEPASVDAYIGLANIAAAQGRLADATDLLGKGLAHEPRNLRVQVNLASVYAMRGMSSRAIAGFEAAVRLSPENPDIHYNLGLAYAETGRTREALAALRTALKLDPSDQGAARKIGELERRLGR